jgi:hypothetical protein
MDLSVRTYVRLGPHGAVVGGTAELSVLGRQELWDWRRRPELNRGWRFCRFLRVGDVVDPSCLLLPADLSFCRVFGR